MLARLKTFTLLGIEAIPVDVKVDVSPAAMPKTILVGLPDVAVKESPHRVERAMVNSGFVRPQDRVVINLGPASFPVGDRKGRRLTPGKFRLCRGYCQGGSLPSLEHA